MSQIEIDFATDRDFNEKWGGCIVRTSLNKAPILKIERIRQIEDGNYVILGTGYVKTANNRWTDSTVNINYKDIQSGKVVFDPSFPEYGACSLTSEDAKGITVLLSRVVHSAGIPKRGLMVDHNMSIKILDTAEALLENVNIDHLDMMKVCYDALYRKYWSFGEALGELLSGNRISCALSSKITLKLSCHSPDILIMFYNKPIGTVVGGKVVIVSDKVAIWNTCKGDIDGL